MFTFLSPGRDDDLDSNNTSCVLQLQVNGYRFILAGDIERSQERELAARWREELKTDWLLVPHHGSQTSSSSTFLKFTAPDVAVFSSGFANRFGHLVCASVEIFDLALLRAAFLLQHNESVDVSRYASILAVLFDLFCVFYDELAIQHECIPFDVPCGVLAHVRPR